MLLSCGVTNSFCSDTTKRYTAAISPWMGRIAEPTHASLPNASPLSSGKNQSEYGVECA
jgi:hypothetical protein